MIVRLPPLPLDKEQTKRADDIVAGLHDTFGKTRDPNERAAAVKKKKTGEPAVDEYVAKQMKKFEQLEKLARRGSGLGL